MTYLEFRQNIESLKEIPNLDFGIIGYSTFGEPIYYCHYGQYSGNQIIIEASIHAREYLSSLLILFADIRDIRMAIPVFS